MDKPSDLPHYDGPRKNGRMEGYATYTFPSGTIYTGQFLDGEFHGEVRTRQTAPTGTWHACWWPQTLPGLRVAHGDHAACPPPLYVGHAAVPRQWEV